LISITCDGDVALVFKWSVLLVPVQRSHLQVYVHVISGELSLLSNAFFFYGENSAYIESYKGSVQDWLHQFSLSGTTKAQVPKRTKTERKKS